MERENAGLPKANLRLGFHSGAQPGHCSKVSAAPAHLSKEYSMNRIRNLPISAVI